MSTMGSAGRLPGTDAFIVRCERMRAWNYVSRATAQSQLGLATEPAGAVAFDGAWVWFSGARARVQLLDEENLAQLPAIEAWLEERRLVALFDVVPTLNCRPVALALAERGYRLVSWQPMLYLQLALPVRAGAGRDAIEIRELAGGAPEFLDTFMSGYEVPPSERESRARVLETRWLAEGARRYLACKDGKPLAAATLVMFDGIARLANCATRPEARNLGAQAALIRARLRSAIDAGLEIALADARQDSPSLRNLSRSGFAVCAQITQWRRAVGPP